MRLFNILSIFWIMPNRKHQIKIIQMYFFQNLINFLSYEIRNFGTTIWTNFSAKISTVWSKNVHSKQSVTKTLKASPFRNLDRFWIFQFSSFFSLNIHFLKMFKLGLHVRPRFKIKRYNINFILRHFRFLYETRS